MRTGRVDGGGFRDASPHRVPLPSPYNAYALTTADPAYEADREDLQVLFRPLFWTSFVLADALRDDGSDVAAGDAEVLVLSSASSKTAYGTAALIRGAGREVVGLTSAGNVDFTESLGVYDRVLAYGDLSGLVPTRPAVYVDFSGSSDLRHQVRERLGTALRRDVVVGVTSQEPMATGPRESPRPSVFFAPAQMARRSAEWGREGLDARFGEAWRGFAPEVERWVDVVTSTGPAGLRAVWLEVLAGRAAPRTGHVVDLSGAAG